MQFISVYQRRFSLFACLAVLASCGGVDPGGEMNGARTPAPEVPGGGDGVNGSMPGNAGDNGEQASLGGQSGGASGAANLPACYCGFSELAKARVVTAGVDGACAVFELIEKPAGIDYYHDLNVGDRFGGHAHALCEEGLEVEVDAVVYVRYWPGDNATSGCEEYADCSQTQCGAQPQEGAESESGDYLERLADWDQCDSQCLEQTRQQCDSHSEQARYSGTVTVAGVGENDTVVFRLGETYAVPPAEVAEPTCFPGGVPDTSSESSTTDSGTEGAVGAPPPQDAPEPSNAVCEIPQ